MLALIYDFEPPIQLLVELVTGVGAAKSIDYVSKRSSFLGDVSYLSNFRALAVVELG